ncbi:MAG TPA: SDR family oxidoreductase, partial [Aquella sp.]|nr:SDR family oxidoreductase [Aquella sp.]
KIMAITGANSGIGLECVKQFLTDGWHVSAISRKSNNLANLTPNDKLDIYECDVTNYTALQGVVDCIIAKHKVIDGLINNAGVSFYSELQDLKHSEIQDMIDINVKGLTNALEIIIPIMQKNKSGTVLNMSSLADRYPRPNSPVYAATKAYVRSISDSLRVSCAKYNIRVMNLSPATVNTPLLHNVRKMDSGYIEVADFVSVIKFMFNQPHNITIRDLVIAPTAYEG